MNLEELVWQRGPASEILREARKRFQDSVTKEPASAHVALASAHYSLIKRYTGTWWKMPLAMRHAWTAVYLANAADELDKRHSKGNMSFTADEIDVITRIWTNVPKWLGGWPHRAELHLYFALAFLTEAKSMKPHTRALMLITLGNLRWASGDGATAWRHYAEARDLIRSIEIEDSPDRERQLVRVMSAVGFFYYDHASASERRWAEKLVERALEIARFVSKDQEYKILAEWWKRRTRIG